MKIQCELCKEIVPIGTFRSTPAGIDVTCAACGGEFFVASGAQAAGKPVDEQSVELSAASGMVCPKCGDAQPETEACRTCGLRVGLFEQYEMAEGDEHVSDLEPLWAACVATWDDADAHKALVETAAAALEFGWAARRYRARLRVHPDDETATEQLDRIARMAAATLAAVKRDEPSRSEPYKNVALLLLVLVLFAGLGGLYFLFKVKSRDQKPPVAPDVKFVDPPVRAPTPSR